MMMPRQVRRLPRAALAAALLLAALWAGMGRAQAQDFVPPGVDRLARPADTQGSLQTIDLTRGLRFGLGIQQVQVQSAALDTDLEGKPPFADGVLLSLDAILGDFRVGYARRIYRRDLPADTTLDGQVVDFLAFESDQLWVFHGFSPWRTLYLGYGAGVMSRRYTFLPADDGDPVQDTEALAVGGLMADYAIAPPFTLQLRLTADGGGKLARVWAATLSLAYHLPL